MGPLVIPTAFMRDILTDLAKAVPGAAAAGPLNGALVKLFTADIVPNRNTLLAALTPATFTGYAASTAVAWGVPITDEDGATTITAASKQFSCTDDVVTEDIWGWFLTDAAGTKLLCSQRFDNKVIINGAGDGVVVLPVFGLRVL